MRFKGKERQLHGGEAHTTNNRMELLAVIEALRALTRAAAVRVTTDSQYVKNGITQWIHGWKRNGWKTSNKKPVKNEDLWRMLDELVAQHDVEWAWVKGHSGHPENELADELANRGIDELE
jgi:ribonuclease HI